MRLKNLFLKKSSCNQVKMLCRAETQVSSQPCRPAGSQAEGLGHPGAADEGLDGHAPCACLLKRLAGRLGGD